MAICSLEKNLKVRVEAKEMEILDTYGQQAGKLTKIIIDLEIL
ncbi:hypothetical protein VB620_17900 [Nodularia harveyana UHCC-0300]|uniref:Uncharacterized protein n=1 Tax=Nodularia harveyana UHCC-0300 TaxID=2974287 RepID=A0ABU5UI16_9CYAN|nr:hypothetical protein [Nodularia harveyana]MEA5583207.1 hypothetical protein [Nodularia harveyana UHCC-0300]